ncbi:MAG TPA: FAD-dependent oxidoreductase [Acetobacteraceae bacterium]|jgi:hypothetical protein
MAFSFAIIGGGWYGCHIASSLMALGFDVTVYERHERLLHEASGNNQFRLHMGFHYPRHYATRMQSRDGFVRFNERYPGLGAEVGENIYAVPQTDSLIDFATYKIIMMSSGINFTEVADSSISLSNVDGMLITSERVLLLDRARKYFVGRLGHSLRLGSTVGEVKQAGTHIYVDGEEYDYVIDATWGHYGGMPIPVFYEPTLLLYYEATPPFPAVTLVDGPLCSIYPTEDPNIYTLSSVPHTPLGRFTTSAQARACRDAADRALVIKKMAAMEEQISRYVPYFRDRFRFVGPQFAIKTKPYGGYDDRSCYVFKNGKMFSVMSGKIDTIFFAVERILSMIEASEEDKIATTEGALRSDIIHAAV